MKSLVSAIVFFISGFLLHAQTNLRTVMVDTNGVVQRPTNFWSNAPTQSSSIDLSTTNATGILPVSKGGTGATNAQTALTNLNIFQTNSGLFITTATNVYPNFAVVIGVGSTNSSDGAGNVVIGQAATGSTNGAFSGGVAVGRGAFTESDGTAIGRSARASVGVAIGLNAVATNGYQIGAGTNTSNNTVQFLSAGSVNTNEWGYVANISVKGGSRMTNTNGVTATNTIIGYDGTNYMTNTIIVIDGIITSWTQ